MSTQLGFQVGSGPAALQCGFKDDGFPPFLPEDVPVAAPDAGNVDPAFASGFPYMIGPDGAEVSFSAITGTQIITNALSAAGASIVVSGVSAYLFPPVSWAAAIGGAIVSALVGALEAVIQDLIEEEEAMQGADWDWTVPSDTATGDWYSWFTWSGTGGFVDENTPAITPSSIDPALVNWYVYSPSDDYYQDRKPAPYARVYLGATRVTMQQGPGITATAESIARDASEGKGPCAGRSLPGCLGSGAARSASSSAAVAPRRDKRVGKTIRQDSAKQDTIRATSRNDEVSAHKGIDKVLAGAGHDLVLAGRGANVLHGGDGSDELTSLAGADRLKGGSRHDVLQGGPGDDVSIGNGGSDSLFDAQGADRMLAGADDDRIVVRDLTGDDLVDCGSGTDMVIADPADRIALKDTAKRSTVPAGAFTADHTPKSSSCERVYSSVHMPPRDPPSIGPHAGRPPHAPEPTWPVID